jgi:hypothetical protein
MPRRLQRAYAFRPYSFRPSGPTATALQIYYANKDGAGLGRAVIRARGGLLGGAQLSDYPVVG